MKPIIHTIYDKYANLQHIIESRMAHIEEIKKRQKFDDFDQARDGEIRNCEDEISYARWRLQLKDA